MAVGTLPPDRRDAEDRAEQSVGFEIGALDFSSVCQLMRTPCMGLDGLLSVPAVLAPSTGGEVRGRRTRRATIG
jgi:hypothetical protein